MVPPTHYPLALLAAREDIECLLAGIGEGCGGGATQTTTTTTRRRKISDSC